MKAVYRGLTWMAAPALRLLLERRLANGKEDPDRVLERTGIASVARPGGSLSWVHGASVGELVAALPLVRALTDRRLADTVLVTTGTVTSARLARERLPSSAIHQFVPLDHPGWCAVSTITGVRISRCGWKASCGRTSCRRRVAAESGRCC